MDHIYSKEQSRFLPILSKYNPEDLKMLTMCLELLNPQRVDLFMGKKEIYCILGYCKPFCVCVWWW